jgi:hypothetical protein
MPGRDLPSSTGGDDLRGAVGAEPMPGRGLSSSTGGDVLRGA